MGLVVKDISKTFGEKTSKTEVLKDINFEVKDGEFIILMVLQDQEKQPY